MTDRERLDKLREIADRQRVVNAAMREPRADQDAILRERCRILSARRALMGGR